MSLLRSMPSMPFLLDSDLNVVGGSENNDSGDEYGFTTSNIKISDVDLYYGAGVFRFAIPKESYDGTKTISLAGTEVHENVPRRREDLERLNEDESRREFVVRVMSMRIEVVVMVVREKEVTRAKRVTMMIRPHPIFKI